MHYIFRPARLADLPTFLLCARDQFAFDEAGRQDLFRMWQELLQSGAGNLFVFEDIQAPPGTGIGFIAVYVFVTEEFAAAMRTTLPPCIGVQAMEWWRARRSPFLDLPALRRANTEGELSMVCLHSGVARDRLEKPEGIIILDRIVEWIYLTLGGYRLKEYFIDAYSEWQQNWAAAAGFRLCRDYAEYEADRQPPQHTQLYAVTREQALARQGTIVAPLFRYERPIFSFTPPEQEMLLWALTEGTDETLAEELGVALVTVRKRWDRIYDRVLSVSPEFFPAKGASVSQKRGVEKRRPLLRYLRYHLEELRPVLPQKRCLP